MCMKHVFAKTAHPSQAAPQPGLLGTRPLQNQADGGVAQSLLNIVLIKPDASRLNVRNWWIYFHSSVAARRAVGTSPLGDASWLMLKWNSRGRLRNFRSSSWGCTSALASATETLSKSFSQHVCNTPLPPPFRQLHSHRLGPASVRSPTAPRLHRSRRLSCQLIL